MPVIVVANPKGGVGKSTLSTNIAGYLASRGHRVMLGAADRQQSSRLWLGLRPAAARPTQAAPTPPAAAVASRSSIPLDPVDPVQRRVDPVDSFGWWFDPFGSPRTCGDGGGESPERRGVTQIRH